MNLLRHASNYIKGTTSTFDSDNTQCGTNMLVYGTFLTFRNTKKSNTKQRYFYLDEEDSTHLIYISSKKELSHSFLDLRKVSNVCDLVKHNHEIHEISVETPLRTFNFIFTDESKKKTFLYGLRSLIFQTCGINIQPIKQEVTHTSQIPFISTKIVMKRRSSDLFELLNSDSHVREELHKCYKLYCETQCIQSKHQKDSPLEIKNFHKLLCKIQGETLSEEEIQRRVSGFGEQFTEIISFKTFLLFLMDRSNTIFDPHKETVYQSMDHPMTDYYICSSHNTYLEGDQLVGQSSSYAYCQALEKGCRCVEIDCWDGPDGDPLVYHGHTLTSRIKFREVIQTIAANAFKFSEYPLTISLEVHCSYEQQAKMAQIMRHELWDRETTRFMVYTLPMDADTITSYPSPNKLKRCIILKNKGDYKNVLSRLYMKELSHLNQSIEIHEEPCKTEITEIRPRSSLEQVQMQEQIQQSMNSSHHFKHIPEKSSVNEELENMQSLFSTSFSLENKHRNPWQICSLDESKIKSLQTNNFVQIIDFNRRNFTRIYPSGGRVNSSNYDPFSALSVGSQFVALNFQTIDIHMFSYLSLFQENGGIKSGYVLKPAMFRADSQRAPIIRTQKKISVRIIAGYNLTLEDLPDSDECCPFVTVHLRGSEHDQNLNNHYKTNIVQKNVSNPRFESGRFEFTLLHPEIKGNHYIRSSGCRYYIYEIPEPFKLPRSPIDKNGIVWNSSRLYETRLSSCALTGQLFQPD